MKKAGSLPLDTSYYQSSSFSLTPDNTESVPVFILPYGYHALSLFQIAQYYDGSALHFFKNFVFPTCSPFSHQRTIDYTNYFNLIISQQLPNSVSLQLSDRYFDVDALLSCQPLGVSSLKSFHVPKGKESGITHFLAQSRDFTFPHLFSLASVQFSSISSTISITAGQPYLLNQILKANYPNTETVKARNKALTDEIQNLKQHEFQIDWALVSFNGFASLIICRPPQFIRMSDNNLTTFDTFDTAFGNSNIYLVCYRHSQFFRQISFVTISSSESTLVKPINSDFVFCDLLKSEMKKNYNFDFESYLIYSLRFPSFYLKNSGFTEEMAMAAAVHIDHGRCASYFVPMIEYEQTKPAVIEYYRFCFWLRSVISVLKAINKKDLNKVNDALLACFKSLPMKNRYLITSTILIVTETLRLFRQQRGQNDDFFFKILRIFKHVLGDDFDTMLGLQKWEVPRSLRNQVVNIDNCVRLFFSKPFKTERKSINSVVYRLTKYIAPLKNVVTFKNDPVEFRLCHSYIDFLKLQIFDKTIEI